MQKRSYDIRGMSCAACVSNIERAVKAIPGVSEVNVMLMKNRMTLIADENLVKDDMIENAVKNAGYGACPVSDAKESLKSDDKEALKQKTQLILSVILTLALMILSMTDLIKINALSKAVTEAFLTLGVMFFQRKYFISAYRALLHKNFNMDTLVSLGSISSVIFSIISLVKLDASMDSHVLMHDFPLYFESAAGILTFVAVGKYFEERCKIKTSDAVLKLYDLAPKFVNVKRGEKEILVPLDEVKLADLVLVKAGEQIGIDGVVVEGSGYCDESALSGESAPVKKEIGSKILSSSVLIEGFLKVEAQAVGENTTLSKIISLVDDAANHKAPISRIADKVASYFVPSVMTISLLTFISWFFLLGATFDAAINFAISVLVVSCPCALGLATPVAIMAGTGKAASHGILFKTPETLENLKNATAFVFDKTGTLTYGHMRVNRIISKTQGLDSLNLLFAASLEKQSPHPIALAFLDKVQEDDLFKVDNFRYEEGLGVFGFIADKSYALGNLKLLKHLNISLDSTFSSLYDDESKKGNLVLFLVSDNKIQSAFIVGDELKPSAINLVETLHKHNLKTIMLTGDNEKVAKSVAEKLKIDEFKAGLLPQDKALYIDRLKDKGEIIVMVGDGINDSLSLTKAHCGIGIAGSSDIAVSSCDVVLLKENLADVFNAYLISHNTMRIIKENLFWAFIYNIFFIPVAAGCFYMSYGFKFTPMMAALLMSCSSICVVANALRLTTIKINKFKDEIGVLKLMQKTIKIEGMHCNHCVNAVKKTLEALPGVCDVKVSLENNEAQANIPEAISDSMIKSAIKAQGFEVLEIK